MIEKIQLRNGMKVLFKESHKSPVISVQMWVKTGSADEKRGEEGISHFIEHLVFKGTQAYKVGEIAAKVEGSGGELNAYTSFDQTVFYVTISKQFSDVALDVIQEMMGYPLFDPEEVNNEREVVIEEIKRSNDSPSRQSSRLLFETVYKKHPYGIPVIGYEKNIRDFSIDKIKNYYHKRYTPRNMTLLVTGDFESKEMAPKVSELFEKFKDYPLEKRPRPSEPPQKNYRIIVKEGQFEEAILNLAWPISGVKGKDTPALDVLSMILGQGDSSRLTQKLRIEKPLVNWSSGYAYTPFDSGLLAITAGFGPQKLDEVLDDIGEVLLNILTDPVSERELHRAQIALESEDYYSMETVDGLSSKIGNYELLFGDPDYHEKYMEAINALTPADLLRVAKKYLVPERLSMTLLTPSGKDLAETSLKKWQDDWRALREYIIKSPGPKIQKLQRRAAIRKHQRHETKHSHIHKHTLSCGTLLLMRPSHETPTVSVRSALLGGVRTETAKNAGLSELLASVWTSGTAAKNEMDIIHLTESMASSLRSYSGRNTIGLNATFLSPFSSQALELFLDVLKGPIFPMEIIEREKQVLIEALKSKKDNPSHLAIQRFMEKMFGEHPYGIDPGGTEDSLQNLSRDAIYAQFQKTWGAKNLMVSVTGDFEPARIVEMFEKELKGIPAGAKFNKTFSHSAPQKNILEFQELKKEQSHVVIGYPGYRFLDNERHVLQVIQSILAGQGGRLFINLRDKASLAYSVSPIRMEGIDAGYFGAYIGCSPEKATKAIEMMQVEFQRLCEEKVPAQEIERAVRYLIGRHDIDLQRNSNLAAAFLFDEIYGVGCEEVFHLAERLRGITQEDILKVSQSIFTKPYVLSVVGPRKPW